MFDFEVVSNTLLEYAKELGRIPLKHEIENNKDLPAPINLRIKFKKNGYEGGYTEFLKQHGFKKKSNSKWSNLTYNRLCNIWEEYYKVHNKYPNSAICMKGGELPYWDVVKNVTGERFYEFCNKYNINKDSKQLSYEEYCNKFKEICIAENKIISYDDVSKIYNLPSSRWFIDNCTDKSVKTYNEFVGFIGLKPNRNVTKEIATKIIYKMREKLGRNLMYDDFRNPKGLEEIGMGIVNRHWGTFNNMMIDLGFEINQEDMIGKHKTIKELQDDIKRLCEYIFETEGRKNISYDDIDDCEWCLDSCTYHKHFKENLNITISEFIDSIGYIPNKEGVGMRYTFEDGEVTTSKYEFDISMFFRKNNISYIRNVKYKKFIPNYKNNKNCDYVIMMNGITWYIEIAGMIYNENVDPNDKIHSKYKSDIIEKIEMLESENLNYKVIYPQEIKNKSLEELFSFLHT